MGPFLRPSGRSGRTPSAVGSQGDRKGIGTPGPRSSSPPASRRLPRPGRSCIRRPRATRSGSHEGHCSESMALRRRLPRSRTPGAHLRSVPRRRRRSSPGARRVRTAPPTRSEPPACTLLGTGHSIHRRPRRRRLPVARARLRSCRTPTSSPRVRPGTRWCRHRSRRWLRACPCPECRYPRSHRRSMRALRHLHRAGRWRPGNPRWPHMRTRLPTAPTPGGRCARRGISSSPR